MSTVAADGDGGGCGCLSNSSIRLLCDTGENREGDEVIIIFTEEEAVVVKNGTVRA